MLLRRYVASRYKYDSLRQRCLTEDEKRHIPLNYVWKREIRYYS